MLFRKSKDRLTFRDSLRVAQTAFAGYKKSILTLSLISILSAFFGGISVTVAIPLLSIITDSGPETQSDFFSSIIQDFFAKVNIDINVYYLIILILCLFLLQFLAIIFTAPISIT